MQSARELPIGPVVAYGHPKTATRSIEAAVADLPGAEVFHAHVLRSAHFTKKDNVFVPPLPTGICPEDQPAQWSIERMNAAGERITLITAVRDPVAVNISWFFFGLQRWFRSRKPVDPSLVAFDVLERLFYEGYPHQGILNWFKEEWEHASGASLDALGGVRTEGHATTQVGNCRACVFSAHLPDTTKADILADFLGVGDEMIVFPRRNLGTSRTGSQIYPRLKAMVASDPEYLDSMYDSAYARFFFTDDQIDGFRRSWKTAHVNG